MIQAEDFQPTGDVRKDFMAYSEILQAPIVRSDMVDKMYYFLTPLASDILTEEGDDSEPDSDDEDLAPKKNVAALTSLSNSQLQRVQLFVRLRQLSERIPIVHVQALCRAFETCSFALMELEFCSCGLSAIGIKTLTSVLPLLSQLKKISIEMNPLLEENQASDLSHVQNQDSSTPFASVLRVLPKSCKFVSFKSCNIPDAEMEAIADVLSTNSTIACLNLFGNYFTDNSMIALANSLRTNRALIHLNLAYNIHFTNASLTALSMLMMPTLVIGEEMFQATREKLYRSAHGPDLELGQIPMSPQLKGSKLPVHPLSKNKKMVDLLQWDNEVEKIMPVVATPAPQPKQPPPKTVQPQASKAALPIKEEPVKFKIPGNKVLKSLNLSANANFTDEGVKQIIDALQENDAITRLNMAMCKQISENTMTALIAKLTENNKKKSNKV